jgi:predicted ATPase
MAAVTITRASGRSDRTANLYIITGGPGSGKTSVIEALRKGGFCCVDEVGRKIIREQLMIGGDALHWGDRAKFLELMLSRSMGDYDRVGDSDGPVFFDRGIPELAGYGPLVGIPVPAHVTKAAKLFRYARTVFVMPPWREIYRSDEERKQDFSEAIVSHDLAVATYREFGYEPVEVPKVSVGERVAFILERVGADSA